MLYYRAAYYCRINAHQDAPPCFPFSFSLGKTVFAEGQGRVVNNSRMGSLSFLGQV
jgi:hypothetical protein